MNVQRLRSGERESARALFTLMATVFEEERAELSDGYIDGLLERKDFWVLAAFANGAVVGGLTAHTLPMTRITGSELFIFDLAVQREHQRKGIGRALLAELRAQAADQGISEVFVPADNEDVHALDFYRAVGGVESPVTFFTFSSD